MSRFFLRRRTFLRGSAGLGLTLVGLPLLEAMLDDHGTALADGSPLPMQFVLWFMGNGYRLERFEPAATGANFELSEELAPLANVSEYLKVVTGMQNWCGYQVTHHEGMTPYSGYTMVELNGLFSKSGGPTIDQLIADRIQATAQTPPLVRSIQLGISKRTSIMDSGTTMHAVSHRGPNEPLFPEFNPVKIWQALFGELVPKPDDSALRLSVLDAVREDALRLEKRLGALDKQRLEAHLAGLKDLEDRIKTAPPVCQIPPTPTETNADVNGMEPITNVNNVMADLLVYALSCDVTRVASVMFLGGAAETAFAEIGQQTGHHYNTHDGNAQLAVHDGVVYAQQKLAYLCERMKATVDPLGKNLLDTGLVLAGSDCAVGLTHTVARQPFQLIGSLRDRLAPRYHHQVAGPYNGNDGGPNAAGNLSDVPFTVLKCFDPAAASFGDLNPQPLQGWWYGTGSPPGQMHAGSSTVVDALKGPAFGT